MGRRRRRNKRKKRKKRQASEQVQILLVPVADTTCPLCRETVRSGDPDLEAEVCGGCGVVYHRECVVELGGCATLGCERKGQIPSEPLSHDRSWDRYQERIAAERTREGVPEVDEASAQQSRPHQYAKLAGRAGALVGAAIGFCAGGITMDSVSGFDLLAALVRGLAGILPGAIYFGLTGALIDRFGIKEEPVPAANLLLVIFIIAGGVLGAGLGDLFGSALIGALCALPFSLTASLSLFGIAGHGR